MIAEKNQLPTISYDSVILKNGQWTIGQLSFGNSPKNSYTPSSSFKYQQPQQNNQNDNSVSDSTTNSNQRIDTSNRKNSGNNNNNKLYVKEQACEVKLDPRQIHKLVMLVMKHSNFSVQQLMQFRFVSKIFTESYEPYFWEKVVRVRFFSTENSIEYNRMPSNWKRVFFGLPRILHQKDWSLCPLCCANSLGVISCSKQLACTDQDTCGFKINLGFSCKRILLNNNNNNNNNNNSINSISNNRWSLNTFSPNNNNHFKNRLLNSCNSRWSFNTVSTANQQFLQQQQYGCCKQCCFKCRQCKKLVRGDKICWESLEEELLNNDDSTDDIEDDEDDEDDHDDICCLVKCADCIQSSKSIYNDTIFTMDDE